MNPASKQKLITAVVVFGGILALAGARYLGADPTWLVAGGSALTFAAGMLRSMVLSDHDPKNGGDS